MANPLPIERGPVPFSERLKTWARAYAIEGLPVFPLVPSKKIPVISRDDGGNGFYDATTNAQLVQDWWDRYPGANIGIRTGAASDLLVIDVDPRNGGSLEEVYKRFPELRETRTARSGGGGWHLYLRHPGFEVASGESVLGSGLDVKADGGYIVAHPSQLAGGGEYVWLNSFAAPLLECPPTLVEALHAHMAGRPSDTTASTNTTASPRVFSPLASSLLHEALAKTSDGRGDATGYELARRLLARQCGEIEALAVLVAYGRKATVNERDPFTERDARRWLDSARNSNHVRATTSEIPLGKSTSSSAGYTSEAKEEGQEKGRPDAGPDPESFTRRKADGTFPLLSVEVMGNMPHVRPEELVPGKVLKRTLNLTYGDGETGKSYYVQNECFKLAADGVPVWYVAAEGFDGIYLRMLAWLATHPGKTIDPLRVIPLPVQIFKTDDRFILATQAKALPPDQRPQLIVLDTLHRCVVGAHESDNSDMVCLANTAALWRSEFGATTWAIHHEGKSAGQGMRGASCLYDDADSVQYIFRGGDISVIECEKQKDGIPRFEPEAYTLESHSLDMRGYPGLSAKVLRPLASDHIIDARRLWSAEQQRRQPGAKNAVGGDDAQALSETLQTALDFFDELAKEHPDGVFKASWRKRCEEGGIKAGSFDWVSKELTTRRGKIRVADSTGRLVRVS